MQCIAKERKHTWSEGCHSVVKWPTLAECDQMGESISQAGVMVIDRLSYGHNLAAFSMVYIKAMSKNTDWIESEI